MKLDKMHFESYDLDEVLYRSGKWCAENKRRVSIHDVIVRPFIVDGDETWFVEIYFLAG